MNQELKSENQYKESDFHQNSTFEILKDKKTKGGMKDGRNTKKN